MEPLLLGQSWIQDFSTTSVVQSDDLSQVTKDEMFEGIKWLEVAEGQEKKYLVVLHQLIILKCRPNSILFLEKKKKKKKNQQIPAFSPKYVFLQISKHYPQNRPKMYYFL